LEGLRLENVNIFNGHLEYFIDIWDILWPFGTFCVHLVYFSVLGFVHQEKSGNPVCIQVRAHQSRFVTNRSQWHRVRSRSWRWALNQWLKTFRASRCHLWVLMLMLTYVAYI
jgi:hypothetical protein